MSNVPSGTPDQGPPVKVGGRFNNTPPTFLDGQRADLQIDSRGNLRVAAAVGSNLIDVGPSADAFSATRNSQLVANYGLLFNGTTWDRQRGNRDDTTGDSGTKTTTFAGATQTNYNARGAYITVVCGTVSGTTPTLACQLQWSPDAGTTWFTLGPALTNLTTTGDKGVIGIYPTNMSQAAGTTPVNLTNGGTQSAFLNAPLPRTWRLNYTIAGTTPSFAITGVYVNSIL